MVRPDMVSVYPITRRSSLVEHLAKLVADGRMDAEIVNAEGEHSVLSVCGRGARRRAYIHGNLWSRMLFEPVLPNLWNAVAHRHGPRHARRRHHAAIV